MTWLSNAVVSHLREVAVWPELPADRYVIVRPIGRGGMGAVYAARDVLLDREVAIKVSNAIVPASGLDERLRTEARVLARLEHPGIVPVHDAGVLDDGRLFYVMKLARGSTLGDHLPQIDGEAAVLGVFERVAEAVAFAHARDVIHRDLKPSNVMVGSFGEVLVLDWGVAKVLGAADAQPASGLLDDAIAATGELRARGDAAPARRETAANTRIGTPGFMAPEQQRGDSAGAGPAADVYALGALLFWMLTRESPPALAAEAERRLAADPRPAPTRRLRAIAVKCLAPDPSARYRDAGDLVADLARYRAGLAVAAYRETLVERAGRLFGKYRTFILLVAAYLVMRALFAFSQR